MSLTTHILELANLCALDVGDHVPLGYGLSNEIDI